MWNTEQEQFWAGKFGNEYCERNRDTGLVAGNLRLFSDVLARAPGVRTVIEFGANIGLNQRALRQLLPDASLSALEINAEAAIELTNLGFLDDVFNQSLLTFVPPKGYDLAFTKGVLIHLAPEMLQDAYRVLYEASSRYVLVVEYYSPSPMMIPYRGHDQRLFKRDFAGEMLDAYPALRLVDYGFIYRRDPVFPLDDVTWFLMEKHL
jgi:pseudaminic acid biosynthesis-associated methylase